MIAKKTTHVFSAMNSRPSIAEGIAASDQYFEKFGDSWYIDVITVSQRSRYEPVVADDRFSIPIHLPR
jgi:hypothetical protein